MDGATDGAGAEYDGGASEFADGVAKGLATVAGFAGFLVSEAQETPGRMVLTWTSCWGSGEAGKGSIQSGSCR